MSVQRWLIDHGLLRARASAMICTVGRAAVGGAQEYSHFRVDEGQVKQVVLSRHARRDKEWTDYKKVFVRPLSERAVLTLTRGRSDGGERHARVVLTHGLRRIYTPAPLRDEAPETEDARERRSPRIRAA